MDGLEIFFCIAVIAIGVAVIAYILLRTPKKPASFGDAPSIELGEEPKAEDEAEVATEATEEAEAPEAADEAEKAE